MAFELSSGIEDDGETYRPLISLLRDRYHKVPHYTHANLGASSNLTIVTTLKNQLEIIVFYFGIIMQHKMITATIMMNGNQLNR